MRTQQVQSKPTAACILSLTGGIFGIIMSLIIIGYATSHLVQEGSVSIFRIFSITSGIGIWFLISAMVVLFSAVKLNANPIEHTKWGIIILVFPTIGWVPLLFISIVLGFWYNPIIIFSIAFLSTFLVFIGGISTLLYIPKFKPTLKPS